MKKKITLLFLFALTSFSVGAQSPAVSFTSVPTSTSIGTYITINYKYTLASAGKIVCGINLFNDWTYISTVAYAEINPAVPGTDVMGTFTLLIPGSTTPTANLTGLENYKINLELKDASNTWLTGDYSVQNYNFTAAVAPAVSITAIPTSTKVGTNLVVNYKYTAATAGKVTIGVTKNGGVNIYDYISTVVFDQLDPAIAGTDITGTFTVLIPEGTTPTSALTGNENYRIALELKDANNNWLTGDYSVVNYNLTSSLGLNDKKLVDKIAIYPNPVNNVLRLETSSNLSDASFRIINVAGQTINKPSKINNKEIDVSALSSGVYILSVSSKEGNKDLKFIKK
jgi:hypothetical protein